MILQSAAALQILSLAGPKGKCRLIPLAIPSVPTGR